MRDTPPDARIVVGVDGSAPSLKALAWAAAEAARRGVGLDVVHAWMTPYPLAVTELFRDPAPFEAYGRAVLEHSIASLEARDDAPIDVRPVLTEEHATQALLNATESSVLLVVGARGRGGFRGLRLGSVGHHCIGHASCPVVVIPPDWAGDEHGRIVVGVDGSQPSYQALDWSIAEAALRNATLDVVNGCDVEAAMPMSIDREAVALARRTLLHEMVRSALTRAERRPPAVQPMVSRLGAAAALLECARGADLLVVGSRGKGVVRQLLLGSVSQQCVLHATCPVVVVRGSRSDQPTISDAATRHMTSEGRS